jgi:cell division topological specificity factor
MASLIERITGKKGNSANRAKERLHLVLIHDRTDLSQNDLQTMKDRLIEVISDYVKIDAGHTEIEIRTDGREQTLIANIPLKSPRVRN